LLEQYAGNDKWEADIRRKRNDFMAATTHLLPYDPEEKKGTFPTLSIWIL
jgi:hypothetical protein